MRVGAIILAALAVLMAGCASPPGIIEVGASRMPSSCPTDDCAWAWWNATVDPRGSWGAVLPLPVEEARFPRTPDDRIEDAAWWPWQLNLTAIGGGGNVANAEDSAFVQLQGTPGGHVLARSHRFSTDPDTLLGAHWRFPEDEEPPRTHYLWGDFRNVTVTYEVRTLHCSRTASFWTGEWTGDVNWVNWKENAPLQGTDVTTCA